MPALPAFAATALRRTRTERDHHGPAEPGRISFGQCAWQDSNLRPCAPEAHALSPELQARTGSVASRPVELSARIVTLRLAETFVISRESADSADVVPVEVRHDRHSGLRQAAPAAR